MGRYIVHHYREFRALGAMRVLVFLVAILLLFLFVLGMNE